MLKAGQKRQNLATIGDMNCHWGDKSEALSYCISLIINNLKN